MSSLYNNLAEVYNIMYATFINYEEEYTLYQHILEQYNCHSLVEIGCGTGYLASRFVQSGFDYTGLDISDDMLAIATKNNPSCNFIKAGMQDFVLEKQVDSAIITGRTISYLLTNKEVYDCLSAIYKNLQTPGIVCFDFIDANKFIPGIGRESVIHTVAAGHGEFLRESFWKLNFSQSWAFDWLSVFYEEQEGQGRVKIGEDNSTIRAFTKDEIILFLQLTGYNVKDIFPRSTYAFDTFVIVAEKAV